MKPYIGIRTSFLARAGICGLLLLYTGSSGILSLSGQVVDSSWRPKDALVPQTSIQVDADLVQIPVTVVDREDRLVTGLDKESFRLYEDKVQQVITHFARESTPASVAFVLDTSGSMSGKLRKAREAISVLLDKSDANDEFLLVEFNERADMVLDISNDPIEVRRQLGLLRATGRTALLDAVHRSIYEIRRAHNPRKALVIVSDGGDNCSRRTISEVKNLVRESDVQIYALGIFDPADVRFQSREELGGPALLKAIAKQSGGRFFEISNLADLPEIAERIADSLRTRYVLGYSPTNARRDGKYHKVDVKVLQAKGGQKLQASWRRGYLAIAR